MLHLGPTQDKATNQQGGVQAKSMAVLIAPPLVEFNNPTSFYYSSETLEGHSRHLEVIHDNYYLSAATSVYTKKMAGRQETINLDTLEPQQLAQVKKQLDEELEHLTTSFAQLHAAQNKFKDCLQCVKSRAAAPDGSNSVLVPLTNSLYVRGELTDAETVLVDVGTGFLVEKKLKSAEKFYESKVEELGNNLKDLEVIVQRKQTNARTIEEVLRQKIMAGQGQADQQA